MGLLDLTSDLAKGAGTNLSQYGGRHGGIEAGGLPTHDDTHTQLDSIFSLSSANEKKGLSIPSPIDDMKGFVSALVRHVSSGRYLTLFSVTDPTLLSISEHRENLAPYLKLVLPSHTSVMTALDKSKTINLAQELEVPTPKTFLVNNISEVTNVSKKIHYPAVIKPRRSYVWGKNGKASFSRPFYVNSPVELISNYNKIKAAGTGI